jgi:hypothetical protein
MRILLVLSALPQPRPEPADLRALTSAANLSLSRAYSAIWFRANDEHARGMLTFGRGRAVAGRRSNWAADGDLHPFPSACLPGLARLTA